MKTSILLVISLLTAVGPTVLFAQQAATAPLKSYVQRKDDSYRWVKRREGQLGGGSYVELTLTSQNWKGIEWKHQLFVFKPAEVGDASRALMLIAGGSWRDELSGPVKDGQERLPGEASLLAGIATEIRAPVAVLLHVPHQPIFDGMHEDDLISHTFEQFLKTQDATWPLLLPMVKSAVAAMDAVQEFARRDWSMQIEHFTLTGASKRGWTTWLTATVDARVQGIAPMVIDVLNMAPQMKHQLETWGEFSEQIEDYTRRGLQQHLGSEKGQALLAIVDPYAYRKELTQPKLILLGTNDRYWPLDALNLYWDDLPGPKHILYVPNNGHGLRDLARVVGAVSALHLAASGQQELPQLSWKLDEGDRRLTLQVDSDVEPATVSAWVAHSASRDFRDAAWRSYPAQRNGKGFFYRLDFPKQGYSAMFGEANYRGKGLPFYLSTNVRIIAAAGAE